MTANLCNIIPPEDFTDQNRVAVFEHVFRCLTSYRDTFELYADAEYALSSLPDNTKATRKEQFQKEINDWAQDLLEKAWVTCHKSAGDTAIHSHTNDDLLEDCPELGKCPYISTGDPSKLPKPEYLTKILNTILFLHITSSKQYSARTRSCLSTLGTLDEQTVVSTLKNPARAIREAQKQADDIREAHAERGRTLRTMGVGLGAVAGGVFIGLTGGLAAPLVGAGITTLLGWLGVGGTAIGLLTSGLAGSSVVCGALFGAYGAQSTASMVNRHIREIRDLAFVPVGTTTGDETLGVRLCVSGWLSSREDVTAPWTVYNGGDTYALRWEVEALEELSNALVTLVKSHVMKYVKVEVIKRTVLAGLMNSLAPVAWLKIGQIIDNPWMNARALAVKAGSVLGDLLSKRVFGNRPITLSGYSLGSLVIFEALKYLASLPPAETAHLIHDVYLFGTPTPVDSWTWTGIRRLVGGRLVNGYSSNDYVLAVLCRLYDARWEVAGLQAVEVMGVENVLCDNIEGHTMWREKIGDCLRDCNAI